MKKTVLIQKNGERLETAVLEDKYVVSAFSQTETGAEMCGNIYLGRVANVVKGMQAAFVDIGLERTAFLSGADNLPGGSIDNVHAGEELILQIVKVPGGEKGALVSANIKLSGRTCVLMPFSDSAAVSKKIEDAEENERLRDICRRVKPNGMGMIVRTNAAGCSESEIAQDMRELSEEWQCIRSRAEHLKAPVLLKTDDLLYRTVRDVIDADTDAVWVSGANVYADVQKALEGTEYIEKIRQHESEIPLFMVFSVPSQIDKALARRVWLRSGGFLVFDDTEAMHVIDVNTGKFTGTEDIEKTILTLNLEAAEEIVRQIRLRDIGGIIIVDFIDMKSNENKEILLEKLRNEFKVEGTRTKVVDITPLGLCEISRKKQGLGLKAFFGTEK